MYLKKKKSFPESTIIYETSSPYKLYRFGFNILFKFVYINNNLYEFIALVTFTKGDVISIYYSPFFFLPTVNL